MPLNPTKNCFKAYNSYLQTDLQGKSVLNYISSHDDSWPFDKKREKPFEAGTKLLLTPGISQIYYGDESARSLDIVGTQGDATLRLPMNWNQIEKDEATQKILDHFQKLGQFRRNHPAIGAGIHNQIPDLYYTFSRIWGEDQVVIALDVPVGEKEINVGSVFAEGTVLIDAYSGVECRVSNGKVKLDTPFEYVLLERND
jgi:alpha-amylase